MKHLMRMKLKVRARIPKLKYHHLFVCPREKTISLSNCLEGKEAAKYVYIPGNRRMPLIHTECTDFGRGTTKGAIAWISQIHKLGLSFDGNFSVEDLYVDSTGAIKAVTQKRKALRSATPEGKKNDCMQMAKIIKHDIFSGNLPKDVEHLLMVLRRYREGDEILVETHSALLNEREKLALFVEMFAHMELLEKVNHAKYQRILDRLPFKRTWRRKSRKVRFLRKVYNFQNRGKKSYQSDPSGMLKLQRNSLAHLVKDSSVQVLKIKTNKDAGKVVNKTGLAVMFKHYQISHMFAFAFPKVLPKLQRALHHEGELTEIYSTSPQSDVVTE